MFIILSTLKLFDLTGQYPKESWRCSPKTNLSTEHRPPSIDSANITNRNLVWQKSENIIEKLNQMALLEEQNKVRLNETTPKDDIASIEQIDKQLLERIRKTRLTSLSSFEKCHYGLNSDESSLPIEELHQPPSRTIHSSTDSQDLVQKRYGKSNLLDEDCKASLNDDSTSFDDSEKNIYKDFSESSINNYLPHSYLFVAKVDPDHSKSNSFIKNGMESTVRKSQHLETNSQEKIIGKFKVYFFFD